MGGYAGIDLGKRNWTMAIIGTNGKVRFHIMERVGGEVRVLNSAKLPLIWDAPTKTDKEDAMKLARLIEERRDEKLPLVPLSSEQEIARA
jgi:hypothetical protein